MINEKINLGQIEDLFDENWERIVNILSEVVGTDIALINKIEGSKLEVLKKNKSSKNPFSENEAYDLATVYCNKVVKNERMLEINNAAVGEKWADYKGLEYGLISYLGYPIFNPEEEVVGTICVESREEKYFTKTEKELLIQFKEVIENQLKQFELTRELERNIEEGKQLHKQYLPSDLPEVSGLSFGTYYESANQLGGDFYDAVKIGNKLLFYISDVSGHNLSSSMLNIFLKETINSYFLFHREDYNFLSPANILSYIRDRFLEENFSPEYFICLLLGVIDLTSFELKLGNAGIHLPAVITQQGGRVKEFSCKGLPIANIGENIIYEDQDYHLKPGDTLYLSTDGLIEQTNVSGQFYGQDRLFKIQAASADLKPKQMLNKIYEDFWKFKGNMPIQDDLTSFLIQRRS
jgi:serine phosphatase RsbU (regulator of sigma subunit)